MSTNAPGLLSLDHKTRIYSILDASWKIFKSKFIYERHPVLKEAPFQHHFANIISTLGGLYCIERADSFLVDLETKCENIKNKSKYLDITCSFGNSDVSCALELKFKTDQQRAQDWGRIDAYVDIEALELACKAGYTFAKFYMITNSTPYINQSSRGVGTVFATHDGFVSPINHTFRSTSKGREGVEVCLEHSYRFDWEKIDSWYFLDLTICDVSS